MLLDAHQCASSSTAETMRIDRVHIVQLYKHSVAIELYRKVYPDAHHVTSNHLSSCNARWCASVHNKANVNTIKALWCVLIWLVWKGLKSQRLWPWMREGDWEVPSSVQRSRRQDGCYFQDSIHPEENQKHRPWIGANTGTISQSSGTPNQGWGNK